MRKFSLNIFLLCFLLALIHLWQFFDSEYNINCIVRCIAIFVTGIVCLFFKNDFVFVVCYICSLVIYQLDSFNNYSCFFFAYILFRKLPKAKYPILLSYVISTFIVCELHDKNASHLMIHFLMCAGYFVLAEHSDRVVVLDLSEDERKILLQLEKEGRTVDDVDGFSKSTVLRKLEEACNKNHCTKNADLRALFRKTIK